VLVASLHDKAMVARTVRVGPAIIKSERERTDDLRVGFREDLAPSIQELGQLLTMELIKVDPAEPIILHSVNVLQIHPHRHRRERQLVGVSW